MADKPITTPFDMNAATFTVEADDYTEQIGQVRFTPTTPTSEWRGIGGNVLRRQGASAWAATIGYAQDLAAASSFMRYLMDHEGEAADVALTPISGGDTIYATLILAPGEIGGTAGPEVAQATVTMVVDGKPSFTAPTP